MSTAEIVLSSVLGTIGIAANFLYWWMVASRWEEAWRKRCERRYDVKIYRAGKSMWEVREGGSWLRRRGIELLQLAFFMAAMLVWATAIIGILLIAALIDRGKL